MILCVVGPSCAGKTTLATHLRDRRGWLYAEASEFVRARYDASGSKDSLLDFVEAEFANRGKATFCQDLIANWKDALRPDENLVISGFRAYEEYLAASVSLGPATLVGIYADSRTRFQRKVFRDGRSKESTTYEAFVQKDMREFAFGIARMLGDKCAEVLFNLESLDHYYLQIDCLAEEMEPHKESNGTHD